MERSVPSFCALFSSWLRGTDLFPDRTLHIDLLVNPHAGAFRQRRRLAKLLQELEARVGADAAYTREHAGRKVTVSTRLTSPELPPTVAHPSGPDLHLIVVAGGDGTSRSALISALGMTSEEKSKLLFFRMPLGTGNDSADAEDFATCLEVLSGRSTTPTVIRPLAALEVTAPRLGTHFSFNIASVGLDAWVGVLTNRFKKLFPGNSYALMVDAATLFYEWLNKLATMTVVLEGEGSEVNRWVDQFLFVALGTSGHRTYGAKKKILPDDDNLCMAHRVSFLTKLAYRQPVYHGTHRGLPGIEFARGDRLQITQQGARLPMQLDGEVFWLEPGDFPV